MYSIGVSFLHAHGMDTLRLLTQAGAAPVASEASRTTPSQLPVVQTDTICCSIARKGRITYQAAQI